jgi:hypothetical protein
MIAPNLAEYAGAPPYRHEQCGAAHLVVDRGGTNVFRNNGAVFHRTKEDAEAWIPELERQYVDRKRSPE